MKSNKLNKIKTYILFVLLSFICIVVYIKPIEAKEHKVIRVGYTSNKGFIEKQGDSYTGYLYDYLREISIYTNWEYEFIVFMTDIDQQDIEKVDERLKKLCKLMNRKIEHNGLDQEISLSIGAVITQKDIDLNKLYTIADEMLYEVKRNGKNGFKIESMI